MKKILLADDEQSLRILVETTLESPDHEIVQACDGDEALALARDVVPDLILLDWMMPGRTGVEVARELKADPATASIPVVLLTAKGQDQDREVSSAIGVQAHLIKPFSPLELLSLVEGILR